MSEYKVILASASPRRREILSKINIEFEVIPSGADENINESEPAKLVEALSKLKASDIFDEYSEKYEKLVVIGSDTVVAHKGDILGKPKSPENAFEMIRGFAGDIHTVYSGVTILIKNGDQRKDYTFNVGTDVDVAEMSDEEIKAYIASGEPFDKAGAYAIQGLFAPYIRGIHGDYYNIVGFPIHNVYKILVENGILR